MAQFKLSRAYATKAYDGFEGIDSSKTFNGEGGVKSLSDFRLRLDGALEKRGGLGLFTEFDSNVRAVHQLSEETLLVLSGRNIYSLDLPSGQQTLLYTLTTSVGGESSFFSFNGNIYLLDGIQLFKYVDGVFLIVYGYVPLYGKDWHPLYGGDVYEPLNMLSTCVRISFNVPCPTYQFELPFYTASIDAVYHNGERVNEKKYQLSESGTVVYTDYSYDDGVKVEMFLTISNIYTDRTIVTRCRHAVPFGNGSAGTEKILIAFYDGRDKNAIYPSSPVPYGQVEHCGEVYPNISDIYVTLENALYANDGQSDITAVCQKDDGLMVFTADRASMLTIDAEKKSHLVRVSLGRGCSSPGGAVILDDTPVTVSYYGIFKWDPSSYEEGEYRASCISKSIRELLFDPFFTSAIAYHYRKKDELWFCDPADPDGLAMIYSIDSGEWYTFTGIGAEYFFEYNGELGFFRGAKAYIFSAGKLTDTADDGERAVNARLESGIISFGDLGSKKRLSKCFIHCSKGASFTLSVTDAEGRTEVYSLSDRSGERFGYVEKRLSLHRSRHYSFTVETEGNAVIYGITLAATD